MPPKLADHLTRALKWHYGAATEDKGVNEARANAAEIVAWRFLTHLSEREVVDYCLYEIPDPAERVPDNEGYQDEENGRPPAEIDEHTSLLGPATSGSVRSAKSAATIPGSRKRYQLLRSISRLTIPHGHDDEDEEQDEQDPTKPFVTLNALEIAAVADAKRFLSQHVVQKIITGIWNGDIVFWESKSPSLCLRGSHTDCIVSGLAVDSVKRPRFYNRATSDPFSRLRVPKYLKSFEVLFFLLFLCIYYSVLIERNPQKVSGAEVLLYIWFAAFTSDELSEWSDAGSIFYVTDVSGPFEKK